MRLFLAVVLSAFIVLDGKAMVSPIVSMITLIANPEKYNGSKVVAVGYLVLEFENMKLFLSEDDAKHGIGKNALTVLLTDEQVKKHRGLSQSYVLIEGLYDASQLGFGALTSGTILDVSRIEKWE